MANLWSALVDGFPQNVVAGATTFANGFPNNVVNGVQYVFASGNISNFATQFGHLTQGVANGGAYFVTTVTRLAAGGLDGVKHIQVQSELNAAGELLIGWANPNFGTIRVLTQFVYPPPPLAAQRHTCIRSTSLLFFSYAYLSLRQKNR